MAAAALALPLTGHLAGLAGRAAPLGRAGEPPVDAAPRRPATSPSTPRSSWPRSRARRPSSTSATATCTGWCSRRACTSTRWAQPVQVHLDPAPPLRLRPRRARWSGAARARGPEAERGGHGQDRLRGAGALLRGPPARAAGLRAASRCSSRSRTAAPMRCWARPAAARPPCSTSSRACCSRARAGSCSTGATSPGCRRSSATSPRCSSSR